MSVPGQKDRAQGTGGSGVKAGKLSGGQSCLPAGLLNDLAVSSNSGEPLLDFSVITRASQ